MFLVFILIVAILLTICAMPALIRVAPRLGLIDQPDARKVHAIPVPRCGGIGLAIGALAPLLIWGERDPFLIGLLAGMGIILLFGIWDDIVTLDFRWKFFGQILAIMPVMATGTVLTHLPLLGEATPMWLAMGVTFILLLGVTNAVNLFDGLDGMAGGCALLSLAAIAVIAFIGGNTQVPMLCLAIIGGIIGFLRFNTWPAIIFMGDAGSQLLGFATAVLSIRLVTDANTAVSPAIVGLLLGLPILDTLMVMIQRKLEGRSMFAPDKSHIHHKFLRIGLHHYETVSIVYLVQAAMVGGAILLRYEADITILSLHLLLAAIIVGPLTIAVYKGWQVRIPAEQRVERRNPSLRRLGWLPNVSANILMVLAATAMTAGSILVPASVVSPFSLTLAAVVPLSLWAQTLAPWPRRLISTLAAFLAGGFAAYAVPAAIQDQPALRTLLWATMTAVIPLLVLAIRVTRRDVFRVTPQDVLIGAIVLVAPNLIPATLMPIHAAQSLMLGVLLFYACEFVLSRPGKSARMLAILLSSLLTLLAVRGLLAV
ncbi:glycosyltransferase family 4 protein [Lacibacterium aquatile]|uniref:Glycosyltransferase family 4 protein n=1 Tax=Lacibacterium aquatile TaxID=1168082 RepID=A0ABW5E0J0_9PROT